jgi:hypothetical protein
LGELTISVSSNFKERVVLVLTSDSAEDSLEGESQAIEIEDDFDLFHTILYYIYTNRIKFSTNTEIKTPDLWDPKICSAEAIYAIVDRMCLEDLKSKAAFNLTCTAEYITERVLGDFAEDYKDVRDKYTRWFREYWKYVKESESRTRLLEELEGEEECDKKGLRELFKRYRDNFQPVIFHLAPRQ